MKFTEYINEINPWDDYGKDSMNVNLITEAGLSRVLSKIQDNESFVIITAYRNEYDKNENISRNRKLRNEFNKRKMGVYQLVGHWQECQLDNVEYKDCPKDKLVDVIERSYLSIKPDDMSNVEFQKFIVSLIKEFKQDGALIKFDDVYYIIDRVGNRFKIGTKLNLNKISQAYSQYVKKMNIPFIFEGVEVPGSNSGRMIASKVGILYPVGDFDDLRNWSDIIKE